MLVLLTLAELFPRHPVAWVGGALLVAFQPMFGFMSGAVNNDMGVDAAAAGVLLLLIVALRRGPTLPVAAGAGALVALAPLFKGTAYTFFVVAGLAIVLLATDRRRRRLRPLLAFAGAFLAVELCWLLLAGSLDRATFTTPSGDSPVQSVSILENPTGYLSYLWQVFLPPLPFMTDLHVETFPFFHIYVERVWGAFGWIALLFPRWVYVAALAGNGRHRRAGAAGAATRVARRARQVAGGAAARRRGDRGGDGSRGRLHDADATTGDRRAGALTSSPPSPPMPPWSCSPAWPSAGAASPPPSRSRSRWSSASAPRRSCSCSRARLRR